MRLADFSKTYAKRPTSPEPSSVRHMWAIVAALGHWFQFDDTNALMHVIWIDYADKANEIVALLGCAFLTALDGLERIGWLESDSEIRDLGLVMSIWLTWSDGLEAYGINENEDEDWRKDVVGYAKRAGIDLEKEGCSAIKSSLEEMDDDVPELKGQFKEYKYDFGYDGFTPYGRPGYDITKWPPKLRAECSLDGVDPLADIPEKGLKSNNIMLR